MSWTSRLWKVQLGWAASGMLPFLFTPRSILANTTGLDPAAFPPLLVNQVQLIGAGGVGFSVVTALALTDQSANYRRGLSFITMVFLLAWSTLLLVNSTSGLYQEWVPLLTNVPAYVLGLLNALFLVVGPRGRVPPPEVAPGRVRVLYAVQGLYHLLFAALCFTSANLVLRMLSGQPPLDEPFEQLAEQQVRIWAVWTTSVGLLAVYASIEAEIRSWRVYAWAFGPALLARAAVLLFAFFRGGYALVPVLVLFTVDVLFFWFGALWSAGSNPGERPWPATRRIFRRRTPTPP